MMHANLVQRLLVNLMFPFQFAGTFYTADVTSSAYVSLGNEFIRPLGLATWMKGIKKRTRS